MSRPGGRRAVQVLLGLVAVGMLAACSSATSAATPVPAPVPVIEPAVASPGPVSHTSSTTCRDVTASQPPLTSQPAPGRMPRGTWEARIQQRGYLIAGVDQDTYLWGFLDPSTGTFSGMDIAMVQGVARAIFGSVAHHVRYVVVPNDQRAEAVFTGRVDLVAETMTITCARKAGSATDPYPVDFSAVYYTAGQSVLVPDGSPMTARRATWAGRRVCAASGSTSLARLAALRPAVVPVGVANESDCLVLLQQGQVDAISTDNSILVGMAAQDPTLHLLGGTFSEEPYGMAISWSHRDFVAFVNGVLRTERSSGYWAASCVAAHMCAGAGAAGSGLPPAVEPAAQYTGAS